MLRQSLAIFAVFAFAFPAVESLGQTAGKDFHDQNLTEKIFNQGALNGADFSDAILKNAKFDGASLKKANFKGADLTGTWLTGADLTGANLSQIKGAPLCIQSHFDKANLEEIDLQPNRCTFKGTDLRRAKISGYIWECDFSGADLRGANLRAMTQPTGHSENRWKGALYDDDTAWPDGFDPVAAGAVLSKESAK